MRSRRARLRLWMLRWLTWGWSLGISRTLHQNSPVNQVHCQIPRVKGAVLSPNLKERRVRGERRTRVFIYRSKSERLQSDLRRLWVRNSMELLDRSQWPTWSDLFGPSHPNLEEFLLRRVHDLKLMPTFNQESNEDTSRTIVNWSHRINLLSLTRNNFHPTTRSFSTAARRRRRPRRNRNISSRTTSREKLMLSYRMFNIGWRTFSRNFANY